MNTSHIPSAAWLRAATGSSMLALVLAAAPARAAEDTPPATDAPATQQGAGLGDIVVTAQRRSESVQKTALSIEVVSGDAMRAAGIAKPDDLARVTPGLQIGGGTTTQVYVRGVGDFGVTATANPAVVTSIDGVAIARPQAISGNFFDLERVELLKGPQGTLYGRNASGGALNILTAQPKLGMLGGYLEGTVGDYNLFAGEGALNIPVGERLAFRISGQVNSRDGYLSDGGDDDKHESIRVQAKYQNGPLTIRPSVSYTHLGGVGTGLVSIPALPGLSAWTGNTSDVAGDAYIAAATAQYEGALLGGCNPAPDGNCPPPPFLIANPKDSTLFQNVKSLAASVQLDYDMDFATLTVIPAYRWTHSRFAVQPSFLYNVGGAYDAQGDSTDGERSKQYSLEARIGHQSGKLKWVIGGNYFKEDQSTDYALNGGLILNTRSIVNLKTEAVAAFGQLTYSLTDTIRLTGGLRYTSDKRSSSNFQVYAIAPSGALSSLVNPAPGFYDSRVTFNRATWKAGVEVDLAPQSMLFADISTGFKAGGFNQAVSLIDPTKLQSFAPEKVTAYTLGIKNRFLDNKLQINAEAFYLDYSNMQLSAQAIDGVGTIVLLTQNAGKARIAGANLNIVAKPWPGGTLRGAVEYTDTKYRQFLIDQLAFFVPPGRVGCPVSAPNMQGLVTIDCSGKPLVRSPKWTGNVGLTQVVELPGESNVTFDIDAAISDKRYLATDFTAAELAKAYANVSASLTYNAPQNRWFIGAWVRNLTNSKIYTGGGGHQSGFVTGWVTSNIAPPRTYGVRFGVKF